MEENEENKSITYRGKTSTEMAKNIILEIFRFEHLRFEEVITKTHVQRTTQQGKEKASTIKDTDVAN